MVFLKYFHLRKNFQFYFTELVLGNDIYFNFGFQ